MLTPGTIGIAIVVDVDIDMDLDVDIDAGSTPFFVLTSTRDRLDCWVAFQFVSSGWLFCRFDWSVSRPIDLFLWFVCVNWLIGWLVHWLIDRFCWPIRSSIACLTIRLIACLLDWLIDRLVGWLDGCRGVHLRYRWCSAFLWSEASC